MANPRCIFVFGPNGYYFETPSRRAALGLPSELNSFFTHPDLFEEIIELALGPDGSYVCIYQTPDHSFTCWYKGLASSLEKWLIDPKTDTLRRDPASLNITLGSGGHYWAEDKNGCSWLLPLQLEETMQQNRRADGSNWKPGYKPACVRLGANGAYFVMYEGGGGHWNLKGGCKELNTFLKEEPSCSNLADVRLDPNDPENYIAVLMGGGTQAVMNKSYMDEWDNINRTVPNFGSLVRSNRGSGGSGGGDRGVASNNVQREDEYEDFSTRFTYKPKLRRIKPSLRDKSSALGWSHSKIEGTRVGRGNYDWDDDPDNLISGAEDEKYDTYDGYYVKRSLHKQRSFNLDQVGQDSESSKRHHHFHKEQKILHGSGRRFRCKCFGLFSQPVTPHEPNFGCLWMCGPI